jgi:hypothetical protein
MDFQMLLPWDRMALCLTANGKYCIIKNLNECPMTFDKFIKNFSTEEQCRDYLCNLRWLDGFVRPKCGGKEY